METKQKIFELLLAVLSRTLAFPLSVLIHRNHLRWVVIGREHGKFLDNAKYFFYYTHFYKPGNCHVVFLSEDQELISQLERLGAHAVYYPSFKAFFHLLRAGYIIVDSSDYIEHGRIGFLYKAKIVQIWHGAPLKLIELPILHNRIANLSFLKRKMYQLYIIIIGRYRKIQVLVSTSPFFTIHAFTRCFISEKIIESGYPRNDELINHRIETNKFSALNVDSKIFSKLKTDRKLGKKNIAYVPTFRKKLPSPFEEDKIDLNRLSDFGIKNSINFILKLHPLMQGICTATEYPSILQVRADSDFYPFLHEIDILITDYSSIYFDFLFLNRPIVFFPYDYDTYTNKDRPLLIDYQSMTPGPKSYCFDSMLKTLYKIAVENIDEWEQERRRVKNLAFRSSNGHATEQIWNEILSSNKPARFSM